MPDRVRKVAWAIAEAYWRRTHRQAAGVLMEADGPADYADRCWQEWTGEARCALNAMGLDNPAPEQAPASPARLEVGPL